MVTSRDVARLAGVSQMTVSRVLQDNGKVAPQTRERVLAAMREAGYRPHAAARTMRTRRTATVGVVVADITNPVYFGMIRGAERTAAHAGYTAVVVETQESEVA